MQLDQANNIMNTLKDIHYHLQLDERMQNKKFHKEQYAALYKHVFFLHIESINSSCISYGLIGSTFTDRVENSGVRVQKDKSILNEPLVDHSKQRAGKGLGKYVFMAHMVR